MFFPLVFCTYRLEIDRLEDTIIIIEQVGPFDVHTEFDTTDMACSIPGDVYTKSIISDSGIVSLDKNNVALFVTTYNVEDVVDESIVIVKPIEGLTKCELWYNPDLITIDCTLDVNTYYYVEHLTAPLIISRKKLIFKFNTTCYDLVFTSTEGHLSLLLE